MDEPDDNTLCRKINYRVCDICGNRIPGFELDITGIAKRYINGYITFTTK